MTQFSLLSDADRLALVRAAEVKRAAPKRKKPRKVKHTVTAKAYQGVGEFPGVDIDAVHRNWNRRRLTNAQTG